MNVKIGEKELYITDAGKDLGAYDANDGTYVFCREEICGADYENYLNELTKQGYSVSAEYSLGESLYTLLEGEALTLYVSFLGEPSELRVYAEPKGFSETPFTDHGSEGDGEVTLWQLEVDSTGSRQNGGHTYVLQLADGRFIIVDGGYYTDVEADRIYNHLKANTPEGEKPRIAAWFMSHMHGDHYGGMIRFAEKYAEVCELEGYYHNGHKNEPRGLWVGMVEKFYVLRDMWEKKPAVYNKVHTGMSFKFPGAEIKVMCTHEDVYPKSFIDGNDTSTVIRIDVAGQRTLLLGDCRDHECDAMIKTFKRSGELKCDIVQWSHHGYEGATKEFYEIVDAPTILFPLNIVGWQENYGTVPQNVFKIWFNILNRPAKDYIPENLANGKIKKVIVAGAGLAAVKFPYVPEGEVVLDYETFYEEHKHKVPEGYELKGYRYCGDNKIEKILN